MAQLGSKIIKSMGRLFNHKISHDENLVAAQFPLPGFQYSDLDRAGQVNIYQLNRILETSRLIPLSKHTTEFFPIDPTHRTVMVMLAQRFSVLPQYYSKFKLDFPMLFENRLVGMGRSAMVRKVTLTEVETNCPFATVLQKLVNMDKTTRKSCDITPQMKRLYSDASLLDAKYVFPAIKAKTPPDEAFTTTMIVSHSDMDMLFHTNQASYMRYCLDCAAEAAYKDYFSQIKTDICLYNGIEASTLHQSESFAGDKLSVTVWEDSEDPYLLHFVITKENTSTALFYSEIKFCDGDLLLS